MPSDQNYGYCVWAIQIFEYISAWLNAFINESVSEYKTLYVPSVFQSFFRIVL